MKLYVYIHQQSKKTWQYVGHVRKNSDNKRKDIFLLIQKTLLFPHLHYSAQTHLHISGLWENTEKGNQNDPDNSATTFSKRGWKDRGSLVQSGKGWSLQNHKGSREAENCSTKYRKRAPSITIQYLGHLVKKVHKWILEGSHRDMPSNFTNTTILDTGKMQGEWKARKWPCLQALPKQHLFCYCCRENTGLDGPPIQLSRLFLC